MFIAQMVYRQHVRKQQGNSFLLAEVEGFAMRSG